MKGMPTGNKPERNLPRFNHDFSARRVYTTKAGLIEPARVIHTVPNEHIQIDVSDFLQSMPLATAAFLRGRKEFSFYYVPYVQLWQNFGQYMAQRDDKFSSSLKGRLYEPRIELSVLYSLVCQSFIKSLQHHMEQNISRTHYTSTDWNTSTEFKFRQSTTQYQGAYVVNSFVTDLEDSFIVVRNGVEDSYTPNCRQFCEDMFGVDRWSNWARKLDMLRYGNLIPELSPLYDEFMAIDWDTIDATDAVQFDTKVNTYFSRLESTINSIISSKKGEYLSVMPILGYNKLFYTFFRNSYYDLDYYVGDFNVDYLECDTFESSIVMPHMFSLQFLDMMQHQWKKDLFTSLMPDTQFGAVSSLEFNGDVFGDGFIGDVSGTTSDNNSYTNDAVAHPVNDATFEGLTLGASLRAYDQVDGQFIDMSHNHDFSASLEALGQLGLNVVSSFDVLALKRAEMIQRYRQTLIRCGNKTKDIMRGIYGSEPVWESDHDPAFIDSFGYNFAVDRVVQTAQTNDDLSTYNGKLGDLGGYIANLGQSRHTIKYNTRGDFGMIICLCYQIIESEYNSYNIDPNLMTLTPEDRYLPDFQDLGFVPVIRRVLTQYGDGNTILGYGTRYYEKKIDVDLVHGILCSKYSLINGDRQKEYFGDFSHWVTPRSDMQAQQVTSKRQFYIDPRILDNNFLLSSDGRQETDQFINNTFFKVLRTNTISDLGLPKF